MCRDMTGELTVKRLAEDALSEIYNTYMKQDFPQSELKPLSHILRSAEAGFGFSLGIYKAGELAGYAVFILCEETRCVLLDYFAILKNKRGGGLGHRAFSLFETYFKENLPAVDGMYIESERISAAENEEQRQVRQRRIAFYLSCGCEMTAFRSVLFGVDYSVLYRRFATGGQGASLESLDALYKKMFKQEHYDRFVSLGMMEESGENAVVEVGESRASD